MTRLEVMYRTEECCNQTVDKNDILNSIKNNFTEIHTVEIYDYNDFLDKRLINFRIQSYLKESNLQHIKLSEALKVLLPLVIINGEVVTDGVYYNYIKQMNI